MVVGIGNTVTGREILMNSSHGERQWSKRGGRNSRWKVRPTEERKGGENRLVSVGPLEAES